MGNRQTIVKGSKVGLGWGYHLTYVLYMLLSLSVFVQYCTTPTQHLVVAESSLSATLQDYL